MTKGGKLARREMRMKEETKTIRHSWREDERLNIEQYEIKRERELTGKVRARSAFR